MFLGALHVPPDGPCGLAARKLRQRPIVTACTFPFCGATKSIPSSQNRQIAIGQEFAPVQFNGLYPALVWAVEPLA